MHSQELIETIRTNLFTDPQKCINTLSTKAFVNNLFVPHLQKLTNILESALQKMSKQNKNISFNNINQQKRSQQLNAQLIICFYSIIIMKSTSKSIIMSEESPIYNQKLAIQTLNKIHKHAKEQDIKKIAAALLLKIPNFNAHKNIVKQLDPKFVSTKTLQKSSQSFRNQCPNLFEQKLNNYKQTSWGKFLSYKPFRLDDFRQIVKELQNFGSNGQVDANSLISIRQQLKNEYQFLIKRIQYIQKQEVFLYEYCQKMTQMFRIKLQFSKLLPNQKSSHDNKNNQSNLKSLPDYNINQLKLKILLQSRNYLLIILNSLIKRISSCWTRKIKWLYDFIVQRIQVYGLEQINTATISEPQVYIQKFKQLKLTINLCHTYYKQFGDGLFPDQKLKGILFTQQFSFYKMIEAILYNQYEFNWQHSNSRIVNYQKNKKVTQQSKNKQAVRNVVNINSKSLNINPHYDLVFQKVIQQITNKEGSSYAHLNSLINEALRFIKSYYKNSQTYFYGGNLITMIQNCKNTYILKQDSLQILKNIKEIIYSKRKMVKQGLQFFCEQFFESYVSKRRSLLEEAPRRSTSSFNIQKTTYLTIHSHLNNDQVQQKSLHRVKIESNSKEESSRNAIRKTKSYDMVFEGWGQSNQKQSKLPGYVPIRNQQKNQRQESQLFYSIKQCSMKDQTQRDNKQQKEDISIRQNLAESKFQSIKQSLSAPQQDQEELILTPQF